MKNNKINYNQLGDTTLHVSEAGFGTYRISSESEDHQLALVHAIKQGINLIDTSSNYGDGDAESVIGKVINQLISAQKIKREDVVIVSKGGYIQGDLYLKSQERKKKNQVIPELVEYSKGLEHCIHPDFIAEQISASLNRLDLEYIDVYLLHNPEYYLMSQKLNDVPIETARSEFYRRINNAFKYLESEVKYGRIKYYGVSSNTLPENNNSYNSVNIDQLVEIAKKIAVNNHFKVIQFPLNLLENNCDVLKPAKKHGLGVLVNRPFNAIINQKICRLVDFIIEDAPSSLEIDDLIQDLIELESTIRSLKFEEMGINESKQFYLQKNISFGGQLQTYWNEFSGYEHWQDTLSTYFLTHIEYTVSLLTHETVLRDSDQELFTSYFGLFNNTVQLISEYYKVISSTRSEQIKKILNTHISDWKSIPTLSQKAIRGLRELDGVNCILVGMRSEDYVNDILIEIQNKVLKQTNENWKKLTEVTHAISEL